MNLNHVEGCTVRIHDVKKRLNYESVCITVRSIIIYKQANIQGDSNRSAGMRTEGDNLGGDQGVTVHVAVKKKKKKRGGNINDTLAHFLRELIVIIKAHVVCGAPV